MNEAIFGPFLRFSEMENVLRNKLGGTMAFMCAQSIPQIPRSLPRCSFSFARHKNEIPNTPEKSLFGGSNSINNPSFFKEIYFFWRTTITDRPVAPWPCHKPEFSNFGSASPKWHSHAGPWGPPPPRRLSQRMLSKWGFQLRYPLRSSMASKYRARSLRGFVPPGCHT